MFLKSVKARGFKSFARPVEFALEPGITVVVGPNGSGKSNIADSVMWAMGEQSPSVVRGASMQDVIFSGSDKLSPAGMAEVELLLDNSRGQIPIEFSEVLISRRLYRDGEGAYFINKSPCRLIDVTELLSDAGLGRNTHSIISQGRVDAILESKPVERRAYIEEAAGLGKYKKRRHRAERKLDAVRRNLERLADVEEEVRSNLRPLKRQATAAERSARLEQQIAEAESRLLKGRLAALSAELDASEDLAGQAGARRGELEARLAATAAERRRTEEMLSGSLRRHQELAARFYGLKSRQENLTGRREATARRLEMLETAGRRAGARRENLSGQLAHVSAELARAEEEHGADRSRLAGIESDLGAQQAELDRIETELERRRRASDEQTRRAGELGALKDRYEHQIEYLSQRQEKLVAMIERAALEAAGRRRELAALKEQARGEEERMAAWHERARRAEAAVKQAASRRDEVEARRRESGLQLRRVEEDLRIAKARLTFIGESDRDRSGLPAAAKKLAEERGVKALVSVVDVEPGYERAVSAVLGNLLFALAASDFRQADQLLRAAMAAELGGVEFVLPAGSADFERVPGEDYLIDHVSIPGQWLAYVAGPLAGVRVVEDADEIAAAAGAGDASGTWVTRDGIVYSAGRRLLGYRADPPSSVLLKHRNERRQLEQEREAAESACAGLKARLEALGQELAAAESERLAAEKAQHGVLQERRDADGSAAATHRQQRVFEQEIELKEASRGHLEAEQAQLDDDLAEAAARLRETEASLEEMQRTAGDGGGEADDSLAATRLLLSQKVTDLKIAAARARERQQVAAQALERSQPVLERLQGELAVTTFQMQAYQRLAPVCSLLLENIERIAGVFDGVAGGLEATLNESEELADRHSASLRELSSAEAELQQQLSQASNSSTECEVQVAKLRDQVADHEARMAKLCERFPEAGLEDAEAAAAEELDEVEQQIERLVRRRELIGPVNPLAQQEYEEMQERQRFLEEQRADLERSLKELSGLIRELTERIESSFDATFAAVRDHFKDVVGTLFPGGEGRLTLTDPAETMAAAGSDGAEAGGAEDEEAVAAGDDWAVGRPGDRRGIEISVKPARKALRNLSLLSGGERSLVAIAFLFAIFLARPAPFYILDEVEAALDDANITRLLTMLRRYQSKTQFIVITHQKRTMECADVLYGISMGADGTSKVLSRRMDKVSDPDDPEDPEGRSDVATPKDQTGKTASAKAEPAALAG